MTRETFFERALKSDLEERQISAIISHDDRAFGRIDEGVTPWTIAVTDGNRDLGRIIGFEGAGAVINGMHGLKPDAAALRGCEMTVYRMSDELVASKFDAAIFSAFERWLLKRGWRGNIVKRLKFTDAAMVVPIRTFWIKNGFELIPGEDGQWEEHVVKRWR